MKIRPERLPRLPSSFSRLRGIFPEWEGGPPVAGDRIEEVLAPLRLEDLAPVARYVESLERDGWIRPEEARRWMDAIARASRSRRAPSGH